MISRAIVIPQMPNDIVSGITVAAYIMIYTILVGGAERCSRNFALVNEQGNSLSYKEMADICHVSRDLFDKAVVLLDANGLIERFCGISYVNTNGLFDEIS